MAYEGGILSILELADMFDVYPQKEIENLDKIKNDPEKPAVAIIGGAKIETKLPLINSFEKIYDKILVNLYFFYDAFFHQGIVQFIC